MNVIGTHHLRDFLAAADNKAVEANLRALLFELSAGCWASAKELQRDYPQLAITDDPIFCFDASSGEVQLQTLISFETGDVLIRGVGRKSEMGKSRTGRKAA